VIAIVAGEPITLGRVAPLLLEAAGATVLEEIALDAAIRAALQDAGVRVDEASVAIERTRLRERIAGAVNVRADDPAADQALARVRNERGLGKRRLAALLWRTAALRALVQAQDPVEITDEILKEAHAIAHGEKRVARVIVAPSLAAAQRALRLVNGGEPFAQVATELSSDQSAARGGLLEPISAADPAYPAALRTALARLSPGDHSTPISIEGGFAILQLERIIAADGVTLEQARAALQRDALLREERIRMDRIAQRLLRRVAVEPIDPSLERAWRARTGVRR